MLFDKKTTGEVITSFFDEVLGPSTSSTFGPFNHELNKVHVFEHTGDGNFSASIDMPGVRHEDVAVQAFLDKVEISWKRVSGKSVLENREVLSLKSLDPSSVTAELNLGVLTVKARQTQSPAGLKVLVQ